MDILGLIALALGILSVPFVVPIVAWLSARKTRARLYELAELIGEQQRQIDRLGEEIARLRGGVIAPAAPPAGRPPQDVSDASAAAQEVARQEPEAPIEAPIVPVPARDEAGVPPSEPWLAMPEDQGVDEPEVATALPGAVPDESLAAASTAPETDTPAAEAPPPLGPPVEPPSEVEAPSSGFDLESLVGVKLFSAIAGIALVIAAIYFLRYSIESGWLQPPVRVGIGIVAALSLLVLCELKAARRYPVTANALDAAAVAILFSTFFAAHALWDLIPGGVTFALLALVTVLAVVLSIRRESLFIAVLGLLGGFASPALLSTGENRPIPLFAYLLLLNVGVAWVAYRNRWSVLTWLTVILTGVYQWGWVLKYLDRSSVPLAMGIFLVFPAAAIAGLLLAHRSEAPAANEPFARSAVTSAALPLLFAVYLAAIPEYGARPVLLFGFLLLVDAGLLAVALARGEGLLHAAGALTTLLVPGIWLASSYDSDARGVVQGFAAAFVLFYLFSPSIARWFSRPLSGHAARADLAAPLLLYTYAALGAMEPAFASPWPLFAPLLGLVLVIAWRAAAAGAGHLYFTAAFFAVAAQAAWSAAHLDVERLGPGVSVYAAFGLVVLGVPIAARRWRASLEPAWGGGAVLIASLLLLFFISLGNVAPAALWALALLLAILNAALFIESAAGSLPLLTHVGTLLSWLLLLAWWGRAAAAVGTIPSLIVLTGLALVTLGGHAFTARAAAPDSGEGARAAFGQGLYLALAAHLFLFLLASNRAWALPPWPLFGSLAVVTLATSAAALVTGGFALHAAGAIASALVLVAWCSSAGAPPYGLIGLGAAAAMSAYAIGWMRVLPDTRPHRPGAAAAAVLMAGEFAALATVASGGAPPFAVLVLAHAANLSALLWLASRLPWRALAPVAVLPAWLAVLQWQLLVPERAGWHELLVLSAALYSVFAAYPFVRGSEARREREPYVAAILASAMFFFGGRAAFLAGGLEWMIGAVPVVAGAVLALLLRHLLAVEPAGERDTGRLALVAGAALAFVTVAIPLQLDQQWITIGWALEGAALAWLYGRIPHRGLLYFACALLAAVFVRLALNPEIFVYEPRGALRIFNWYLYTYLTCALAMFAAAGWLLRTNDRVVGWLPRASHLLPALGVVLLFLLLNIEIADYYATGPTITFRFGATVSQDLTYTIGWLTFGLALLAAGIYLGVRPPRVAAVALIAVTTCKCFLYDLGSLGGLYRVASLVGLALSLSLVALALQKFVLSKSRGTA